MKKYSRVYLRKGETRFGFRYNYTDQVLESISCWGPYKNEITGEYELRVPGDWEVTGDIELARENWEDNPQYWMDTYQKELDKELAYVTQYI